MKKEELLSAVMETLEKMGMEPKAVEVAKLNDEILHGVTVKLKAATKTVDGTEQTMAPIVYLEQFIDDPLLHMLREEHLPEAAKNIAHQMVSCVANSNSEGYKGVDLTAQNLQNLPFILALCDKELNKKFLADKPYMDVGNGFALFLRIKISENRDRFYTVNLTDSRLEMLNLTKEEAFEKAFSEAECSDTTLCAMPEVLQSIAGEEPTNLLNEIGVGGSPREEEMFLLTDNLYGSAALYRPGLKEKVAEILNDDFYVLPSSIHELLIIPAKENHHSERELGMMVEDVNKHERARNEVLSYKVQKFSRRLGKLISCMDMPRFS